MVLRGMVAPWGSAHSLSSPLWSLLQPHTYLEISIDAPTSCMNQWTPLIDIRWDITMEDISLYYSAFNWAVTILTTSDQINHYYQQYLQTIHTVCVQLVVQLFQLILCCLSFCTKSTHVCNHMLKLDLYNDIPMWQQTMAISAGMILIKELKLMYGFPASKYHCQSCVISI